MKKTLIKLTLLAPMTFGSWELFSNQEGRHLSAQALLYEISAEEKLMNDKLDNFKSTRILWDPSLAPHYTLSWMNSELSDETKAKLRSKPKFIQDLTLEKIEDLGAQAR